MSVREAQERIGSREFQEWRAYSLLEPFGPPADYWRAALVASTMYNMWRGKKGKAMSITDFMPDTDPGPKGKTQAQHEAEMDAAMAMLGGTMGKPKPEAG